MRSTDAEKNHGLPFLPLRVGVKVSSLSLSEFAGEWKKRMALMDPYDNEFRISRFDIERTKTIREMVT